MKNPTLARQTLTGLNENDIATAMREPLPESAFEEHPTKRYLTTISPAHTRERLTQIFGLFGLGWGLKWDPEHTRHWESKTAKGKPRYHYALLQAEFWFRLGEDVVSFAVTGCSDNDNLGDAMEGARTNCISSASKQLLFQLHIYKNEQPPSQQAAPAQKPQNGNGRSWRTIEGLLNQIATDCNVTSEVAKEALHTAGYTSFRAGRSRQMYNDAVSVIKNQDQMPF